ncbi:unnamed protein product, partial [Choristocarpus tenellus]
ESAWGSEHHCVYHFQGSDIHLLYDINLEDNEVQERLENVLHNEYGVTIDEVLATFSPGTDIESSEEVTTALANGVRKLLLASHVSTKAGKTSQVAGELVALRRVGGSSVMEPCAVRHRIETALHGPPPDWRELVVLVKACRVCEVYIIGNNGENAGVNMGEVESGAEQFAMARTIWDCSTVQPDHLKRYMESNGMPSSAVQMLEFTGFFKKHLIDLSTVIAKLAQLSPITDLPSPITKKSTMVSKGVNVEQMFHTIEVPCQGEIRVEVDIPPAGIGGLQEIHVLVVGISGSPANVNLEVKWDTTAITSAADTVSVHHNIPGEEMKMLGVSISKLRPLHVSHKGYLTNSLVQHNILQQTSSSPSVPLHSNAVVGPPDRRGTVKNEGSRAKEGVLEVGSRVEARFRGKGEWYPGVVTAVSSINIDGPLDGADRAIGITATVKYDDGDIEEGVPRLRIRFPGQKQPWELNEGAVVDVRRRGKKIMS